jgi:hypothetical protein
MRIQGIARTMARTRRAWPALVPVAVAAAVAVAAGSCRGGCARAPDPSAAAAAAAGRLALFPLESRVVVSFDFAALRGSPAAGKLAALAQRSQADENAIREFARRTGLDPLRSIDSLVMAFPEEARRRGELGLVVRADRLDQPRLVAYVRDQLQKKGDDLIATAHGRYTLWSARRDPDVAGFFADERTFVLGGGGWAARIADLVETRRPSDSAATNLDLVRLCERAAAGHAIWAAALVPAETRRMLQAEPRFASAATVANLAAGLDLGRGLEATLLADLATPRDAQALTAKVAETLRDAKRNANVLMMGLGPYLDAVSARAVDRTFELRASLPEPQVDDLIDRLGAYLALVRQGRAPGFGR